MIALDIAKFQPLAHFTTAHGSLHDEIKAVPSRQGL